MYGKIFESMFEGSMVGAGPNVFSVMSFVIAKQKPDKGYGSLVRIQPKVLATIIGTTEEEVDKAIDYLCAPDGETTTPGKNGRRLVKVGTFDYQVVNGAMYRAIRNEEERKEQNRVAQQKHRERLAMLEAMTPEARAVFEAREAEEYLKRRKIGKREAAKLGVQAGAQEAIKKGLEEAG